MGYSPTFLAFLDTTNKLIVSQFTNFDFDQAFIHLRGLDLLIAARGGIDRLQSDSELRLMVFWYDRMSKYPRLSALTRG